MNASVRTLFIALILALVAMSCGESPPQVDEAQADEACPEGEEAHPITGECSVGCDEGQTRSLTTGQFSKT